MELLGEGVGDVVELEVGIGAIPAKDMEGGEVAFVLLEMGEGDFALGGVLIAVGGDEEEVVHLPAGAVGAIGAGAAFDDEVGEDAAEDDDGEALFLEADPEDAPGLALYL